MIDILALTSHVLNGFFIHGTNPARPLLFVLFILSLIGTYFLFKKLPRTLERITPCAKYGAVGSLFLLGCVGLFLQMSVFSELGIPQTTQAHFFAGNEYTLSRLVHSHFGKLSLIPLLEASHLSDASSVVADTGAALVPFVSPWMPLFMSVLLMIGLCASLVAGVTFITSFPTVRRKIGALFLYGILAYAVLSASVDGGIFEGYALALFVAYAGFLFVSRRLLVPCLVVAFILGVSFYVILACIPSFPYGLPSVVISAAYLGIFLIFIGSLFLLLSSHAKTKVICLFAFLVLIGIGVGNGLRDISYLHTTIDSGHGLIASSEDLSSSLVLVGTIGKFGFYLLPKGTSESIESIVERYRLPWWYEPISTTSFVCNGQTSPASDTFMIGSRDTLIATSSVATLARLDLSFDHMTKDGFYWYKGVLVHHPCLPEPPLVLQELLRGLDASHFVFVAYRVP